VNLNSCRDKLHACMDSSLDSFFRILITRCFSKFVQQERKKSDAFSCWNPTSQRHAKCLRHCSWNLLALLGRVADYYYLVERKWRGLFLKIKMTWSLIKQKEYTLICKLFLGLHCTRRVLLYRTLKQKRYTKVQVGNVVWKMAGLDIIVKLAWIARG